MNTKAKFSRIRNDLLKHGIYRAVATKIIKRKVEQGIYPPEFLNYLKTTLKPRKSRAKNKKTIVRNTINKVIYKFFKYKCRKCRVGQNICMSQIRICISPERKIDFLCANCRGKFDRPPQVIA